MIAAAFVHVDMLDSYILLATPTPAAQGFILKGKGLEQPSGGCSECDDAALRPAAPCEPREDRHCGSMNVTEHLIVRCSSDTAPVTATV
jgi:hypothetical protein